VTLTQDIISIIPRHIPADIRQDIAIALLEAKDDTTPEEIEKIIRNTRERDRYQKRSRRERYIEDIDAETFTSAAPVSITKTLMSYVMNMVSDDDRAFLLHHCRFTEVQEAAKAMGVSRKTYYKRLNSVVQRVQIAVNNQ
jgi:DNA-directed RNA polymerase specialized sigma24 family protein